jgi:hypothetical protein
VDPARPTLNRPARGLRPKALRWLACLALAALPARHASAQLLPAFGDSRTGTTGMQFLKVTPDARAAGMAGAITAVTDDLGALYWNPAGIAGLDSSKLHGMVATTDYFAGVTLQYGGLVYRVNDKTLVGLSLTYLNSGEMDVTTEFLPLGTGQTFRATNTAVGATLTRVLTDRFRFGVTGRYINEAIAGITTHNAVFDFGFQYDIGLANTRFAVGLSNFGFNTQPAGDLMLETLEGPKVATEFEGISVPAVFRLGLAWDPVRNEEHRFTVAAQLNHPTDNNETYALGLEYAWHDLLLLRTGYELGLDQVALPSAGFGVWLPRRFGAMRIDYGFTHRATLGGVHRLGLAFSLINRSAEPASAPRGEAPETPSAR